MYNLFLKKSDQREAQKAELRRICEEGQENLRRQNMESRVRSAEWLDSLIKEKQIRK